MAQLILGIETSCDETAAALVTDDGRSSRSDRRVAGRAPRALRRRRARGRVAAASRARLARRPGGARRRRARRSTTSIASPSRRAPDSSGRCSSGSRPRRRSPGHATCRSSPSTISTATSPRSRSAPSRSSRRFSACSQAAATRCCSRSTPTARRGASARRSTTPPARPSTRARGCSGSATPAAPRSTGLPPVETRTAFALPRRPCAGARLLVLRAQDGASLRGARPRRRSRGAAGRPGRLVPARDRPRARRAHTAGGGRRPGSSRIAVVGGVAANSELRAALPEAVFAPLALCTDNAAMIASAARFTRALPYPEYLALDAYRVLTRCAALAVAAVVVAVAGARWCRRSRGLGAGERGGRLAGAAGLAPGAPARRPLDRRPPRPVARRPGPCRRWHRRRGADEVVDGHRPHGAEARPGAPRLQGGTGAAGAASTCAS